VPVSLIHGAQDRTSLISHANNMREALAKAGNAPEWTEEADEGHGFYNLKARTATLEKLEAFLNRHIGK